MTPPHGSAFDALVRRSRTLGRPSGRRNPSDRLRASVILVTDPDRLPDPLAAARRLPRGGVVIHRTFGRAAAEAAAPALARLARRRGLILLIGADVALAGRVGAHGVHLPERDLARARGLRRRRPDWILTVAAHDAAALARARGLGLDAALVSPVFASASASAGRPLGVLRVAQMARATRLPIYAMGGVGSGTIARLRGVGVAGVAAVEAFRT